MDKHVRNLLALVGVVSFGGGWCACRGYDILKKRNGKGRRRRKLPHRLPEAEQQAVNEPETKAELPQVEAQEDSIQTPPVVFSPADMDDIPLEIEDLMEDYGGEIEKPPLHVRPYLIEADNYEEDKIFAKRELTLYSDGVVTDEEDKEVNNWKSLVGVEALRQIEAFGERVVFVRNEATSEDFMITACDAPYGGEDV